MHIFQTRKFCIVAAFPRDMEVYAKMYIDLVSLGLSIPEKIKIGFNTLELGSSGAEPGGFRFCWFSQKPIKLKNNSYIIRTATCKCNF